MMNKRVSVNTAKAVGAALLAVLLSACSGAADNIPPQKWQNLDVRVETRPSPPRTGMNEILVMVTDERGRPGYNLLVSLRGSDEDRWVQAIEDGQVGVYRRAVAFPPGAKAVLQIQIKRGNEESELRFPLQMQP
ncbi:MAG: hypothetical protein GC139_04430 [Sideroxydans sp.]|nr:hypothetical protein [Sideroxydans sp.]